MIMHKYAKNIRFEDLIIFENINYIIINKPPYVSTLEDRHDPINILKLAKTYHEDAQVCHRLDKETSGSLVIAKNFDAYRHFSIMLEKRQVKKIYHAVSHGLHQIENLEADQPLAIGANKSRVDYREGKSSLTMIATLENFRNHTLFKCFPVSGRLHQIRVHLAHHKAPIVSDPAYGGELIYLSQIKKRYNIKRFEEEQPLIPRVALHAESIVFRDLENEKEISASAPYPKDFEILIKQLRKHS
ncbi:MAG: 23S rRNA pseudouridine955/2504/2580 synthase [Cyclobacteriaceae bacterium]|jgi:23S rRNA pseudouridine955/2504/2580 synthase